MVNHFQLVLTGFSTRPLLQHLSSSPCRAPSGWKVVPLGGHEVTGSRSQSGDDHFSGQGCSWFGGLGGSNVSVQTGDHKGAKGDGTWEGYKMLQEPLS